MQEIPRQTFVVDLLTALRQRHFSPGAWVIFFQDSWLKACETAAANPSLKRSWRWVTCLIGLLALVILIGNSLFAGINDTLRLLPGFLLCVAWQQSDLFWHLGLNRSTRAGQLLPTIGVANTLTWLRGLCASYLLGRLAGGLSVPSAVALAIFLCAIATDILDGYLARLTDTQSKLGQIADGEADFCLTLALTLVLLQHGMLPLWAGWIMMLRFVFPLLAAALSYLVYARPVRFGSTLWGKWAGLAQCLYFLVLFAPPPLALFAHLLATPLLALMLVLCVAAATAQIIVNVRARIDSTSPSS